jgi:hypothetical protein
MLICVAVLMTLVAVFYAKANNRGNRMLADCKRELAARGEVLDWSAYVPEPVPADHNIFKAPKMAEWFGDSRPIVSAPLDHPATNDFARRLFNKDTSVDITNAAEAARYLAWSDQFQEDFDTIRAALKRPYARIVDDYSRPLTLPFLNVATGDVVVRTLEQSAKCHLIVGQTEKAWQELTLLNDLRRMVGRQGKFITTEGAWVVRGITKHGLNVVEKGLELHAWSEPQLLALQEQFEATDFFAQFGDALRCGRAGLLSGVESGGMVRAAFAASAANIFWVARMLNRAIAIGIWIVPHGEIYESFSNRMRETQKMIDVITPTNRVVRPNEASKAFAWWKRAQEGLPALLWNQTRVNEGRIACALERYRLANGKYPETLHALVPQFIQTLPHDIVNGEPLKYRRTADGSFLLYSLGWNETDNGGQAVSHPELAENLKHGDWVWGKMD